MPKYRFFLLDADNTIFDFDAAERQAWFRAMTGCGLPATDEMYERYHAVNAELWRDLEKNLIRKSELVVERHARILREYGLDYDASELNGRYMPLLSECAAVLPGALDFLIRLRNIADARRESRGGGGIYIITNGVEKTQVKRLGESEVRRYVDGMFVSEAVGFPKPDVRYFDYVFSRIPGFDKNAAVVVGDSLSSDIKGGNNAGITAVWYDHYRAGLPDDPPGVPDHTAQSYDEIFDIITG